MNEELEQGQQEEPKVNYEERAKIQGWVPKEEFRGDKDRWIPADEFVKRADNMMPILKSVNKKLESKVEEIDRKLREKDEALKKIISIQNKYQTDFHDTRLNEILEKQRKAVENSDVAEWDRLEKMKTGLPKPEPIPEKTSDESTENVEYQRWLNDNRWFNTDPELTEYAVIIANQMESRKDPLTKPGKEYELGEAVKRKLTKMFPDKFKNPNQARSDIDESNFRDSSTVDTGKKTWNDLPADAKIYYENQYKHIPGATKEKYLKDYFEA